MSKIGLVGRNILSKFQLTFLWFGTRVFKIFGGRVLEGVKKTSFYPPLVDKGGGGQPMWISERGGGSGQPMWMLIFCMF